MTIEFPEPTAETSDPAVLFARYLDFYRETVIAKLSALPTDEQRRTRLPSGWTPLELLNHLAYMERRWFVWGFLGEDVDEPWGDDLDDRWHVAADRDLEAVATTLRRVGERTHDVLASAPLDRQAPSGPRFEGEPASLAWICFHVLQEYARHAGHLDIAVELAGGPTGE
ncbi:MAG TPA: DUF664 domain-containing protein [Nocardioidaceae bacterium]|nr:DUF664 domain-containing protein [Nocardioidaceae bacterium]